MWKVCPVVLALHLTLMSAPSSLAGPPLICHPNEIEDADSLPWGKEPFDERKSYDVKARLTADVLRLLDSDSPVVVRMETIRRATIYAKKHPQIAAELRIRLQERLLNSIAQDQPQALAWFDAGYLLQCYAQFEMLDRATADNMPGYEWVIKAQQMRPEDHQIAFALSLMTQMCRQQDRWSRHVDYPRHLALAKKGRAADSLLAHNLKLHFDH